MRVILGVLVVGLVAVPLHAGDVASGCAWLCGNWVLDTSESQQAEAAVDAALVNFREPGPRSTPRGRPEAPRTMDTAPDATPEPSAKSALRTELLAAIAAPELLAFSDQRDVILVRTDNDPERRLFPGEPHSRISAQGTTKISTEWRKGTLTVREDRGGKRRTTETYTLLPDQALQLTRVLERPGIKTLQLSTVYRRGATPELESGAQGRPQNSAP